MAFSTQFYANSKIKKNAMMCKYKEEPGHIWSMKKPIEKKKWKRRDETEKKREKKIKSKTGTKLISPIDSSFFPFCLEDDTQQNNTLSH